MSVVKRTLIGIVVVFGLVVPALCLTHAGVAVGAATSPKVELLAKGSAPRTPLRLAVPEGAQAQVTMKLSQKIKQSMSGRTTNTIEAPPVAVPMRASAGAPSPSGVVPISYAYGTITVIDSGSFTDEQVATYQAALAPLSSLTGSATLTPRNELLNSQISGVDQQDPTVAALLSQLADQLDSLTTPFPRAAVGVGARWRSTTQLQLSGIDITQTSEYRLRSRQGDQVVFDVTSTQTAPPQRAKIAGVPNGTSTKIIKWHVTGHGTTTVSLVAPMLPIAAATHVSGTQVIDVAANGQDGTLVQRITADMELTT